MGNTDNIQKAEDIDELWENIHHLQNLVKLKLHVYQGYVLKTISDLH